MNIQWRGAQVIEAVRRAASRGVVRGTESVREEAVSRVQEGPATGRVYTRRGVTHQASAPGEAPASDTGRLANAIETRYDLGALAGTVNAGTDYAAKLENGTESMEPRPFMRPSLAAKRAEIEADIAAEIRSALRT